jgi:hypothetical protein
VGHKSRRHRDVVAPQEVFGLVFMNFHKIERVPVRPCF